MDYLDILGGGSLGAVVGLVAAYLAHQASQRQIAVMEAALEEQREQGQPNVAVDDPHAVYFRLNSRFELQWHISPAGPYPVYIEKPVLVGGGLVESCQFLLRKQGGAQKATSGMLLQPGDRCILSLKGTGRPAGAVEITVRGRTNPVRQEIGTVVERD